MEQKLTVQEFKKKYPHFSMNEFGGVVIFQHKKLFVQFGGLGQVCIECEDSVFITVPHLTNRQFIALCDWFALGLKK